MIKIKNLSQVYKSGKGIFDLNFEVKKGEVFGYLGPNGAGKTTTIRNILGFSNASKGSVTINGKDARKDAAELQHIIGYLPGEIAFFDNMTGLDFLKFIGEMRGMTDFRKRDKLIDMFQLEVGGKIKKMSKGMKQKVGIVAAFMHNPELIVLDEPTSGLDPLMQNIFIDLVEEEKKEGKTIMMSSHIFEEVQRVCDRAGIIKDGKMVAIEDVKNLKAMHGQEYIVSVCDEDKKILEASGLILEKYKHKYLIKQTMSYKNFFAVLAKCDIESFETKKQSLEDIFMKYYGRED